MKSFVSLAAASLLLGAPAFAQPAPASRAASGTIQPNEDDNRQVEAGVIELTPLRRQGDGPNDLAVHMYGTAGGDPAMNGLYTYIAFYQSPGEGHRVFQIGDFNSYRVVSETKGSVLLEIQENVMSDGGVIGSRTRRINVRWTPPADGSAPATIRVTDAR